MSCPWRPNTWEKVAWLQVRVSSMAVPLAHAEGKEREEGDEGRLTVLGSSRQAGLKGRAKKRGGEGGALRLRQRNSHIEAVQYEKFWHA
ncbi:hypothetical protein EYF80_005892 [Liparis tanakae]|uniref:Uncharacterized protein n=1 Tax=Liparis tanakae TaxID=230148 RepID=A0A4Z2J243_9TELE|nr:hypothetical protein EYF80_005892 [Liparis tanakae]